VKLGLFTMPLHTLRLGYKEMYDQDLEAALLCDRLGFDEYWLGEHTSSKVEPISDALQFMSALLPQTRNLVFGTGVLNLPQHFPPKVAADVALFDHMSNGRFLMGIGPGGLPSDFELYGTAAKPRGEMMIECIDMVHKIWASDPPYDFPGKFWSVRIADSFQADLGIGPMPKPYQKPYPPIRVAATTDETYPLVGRLGLPIFLAVRTTTIAHLQKCIGSYHEAWRAAGHPGQGDVALIVPVYVAETAQAARDEPESSMMHFLHSIGEMLATGTTSRAEDGERLLRISYDEVLKELAVYGTAEAVADRTLDPRHRQRETGG